METTRRTDNLILFPHVTYKSVCISDFAKTRRKIKLRFAYLPFLEIWRRIKVIALLAIFVCLYVSLPAEAEPGPVTRIAVPVYFATDRQLNQTSTNLDYTDQQEQSDSLSFGVKNMVITENEYGETEADRIGGLGWWHVLSTNGVQSDPSVRNTTLTRQELLSKLKEIVDGGPSKRPLVVFVHGCCTSFNPSMENAARLARSLQAPVVSYAWAAIPPTAEKYRENEVRQRNSSKRFTDFLSDLESVVGPDRIVLVGHSMGNRFLHEALRFRYWNHGQNRTYPRFRCTAFAAADVNVDDFASDETAVAFNSEQTWITANDTDRALFLSQLQRGFYGRLGAPHGALRKLINTPGIEILEISRISRNSHDLPTLILTQVIRTAEGGIQARFTLWQQKPHLLQVQHIK